MSKWLTKLQKYDGYVAPISIDDMKVLKSPSPSLNWIFGTKKHGIPVGTSVLLGGPAKSGKTFIALNYVAKMHQEDPEGIAVMFNTEFRGRFQITREVMGQLGIDPDRLIIYNTNEPDQIFDRISKELHALCDEGMPLRILIIDSLSGIRGRRRMNAASVMQQQIGDEAATIQDGLNQIVTTLRAFDLTTFLITHVRDEMDPIKVMRGQKYKLQGANATKHFAEFFMFVERNETKAGRQTLDGQDFKNDDAKDLAGKGALMGHKVRVKMLDSSLGKGTGRTGEFTLNFESGIVNQYEELFRLAVSMGVIHRPNLRTYEYREHKWNGLANALVSVRDNIVVQQQLEDDIIAADANGSKVTDTTESSLEKEQSVGE